MNTKTNNVLAVIVLILSSTVMVGGITWLASMNEKPVVHQLVSHHKKLILEGKDELNSAVLDENRQRVEEETE